MNNPSIKDHRPDRKNLGSTGPVHMPPEPTQSYDDKHPNAGTVDEPLVGPTPTDHTRNEADKLENEIDKKRAQTPPD